jgi:hypothetical protein
MTDATSPLFQATTPVTDLVQTTAHSGNELLQDTVQVGKDITQSVGNFIAEPSQLFQPTKAISTLGDFTKNVASFGVESVKGTVQDVVGIGKDVGAIWSEPSTDGSGLFQPSKPLGTLANIGGKVLKS